MYIFYSPIIGHNHDTPTLNPYMLYNLIGMNLQPLGL